MEREDGDPLIQQARELAEAGEIDRARALLERAAKRPGHDGAYGTLHRHTSSKITRTWTVHAMHTGGP